MIDCALSVTKNTKNLHLYPPALLRIQQWKSHPQLGISWQHWHFIKLLLHVTMNIHQLCLFIHVLAIFYVTVCIKPILKVASMTFIKKMWLHSMIICFYNITDSNCFWFIYTKWTIFSNLESISQRKEIAFSDYCFITRCSRP